MLKAKPGRSETDGRKGVYKADSRNDWFTRESRFEVPDADIYDYVSLHQKKKALAFFLFARSVYQIRLRHHGKYAIIAPLSHPIWQQKGGVMS